MIPRWLLLVGGAALAGTGFVLYSRSSWPASLPGRKITNVPAGDDGWVAVPPADLARAANLDLQTYTLARIIGSEFDSGRPIEKIAIGHVVKNVARQRGWTISQMATFTTKYGDQGLFGSQEHGRFASTARDPTDRDVAVAQVVLRGGDPTGGADKFFDPETQDILHARRPDAYVSAAEIFRTWTAEGRKVFTMLGVRANKLALFRPVS